MLDMELGHHTQDFWKYKIKEIVKLLNSTKVGSKESLDAIACEIEHMSEDELIMIFVKYQRRYRKIVNENCLGR